MLLADRPFISQIRRLMIDKWGHIYILGNNGVKWGKYVH